MHGKTLAIIGFGRIGQAVAKRAALGFGMPVLYVNESEADVPALAGRIARGGVLTRRGVGTHDGVLTGGDVVGPGRSRVRGRLPRRPRLVVAHPTTVPSTPSPGCHRQRTATHHRP